MHETKLASISAQLKNGVNPPTERVCDFLGWFGAERRGWRVVSEIRSALSKHHLSTEPDFESAYYYGWLSFTRASASDSETVPDPTVRLSQLEAANRVPLSVSPDATVQSAVSQMLAKDFSQLPVMTGERDVKGLLSWRSIGSRLALGKACTTARDCMEPARMLSHSASLFEAIAAVASDDCILVQAQDKKICGIVTATDLNQQFSLLAEPFLLVGEIERGIRQVLHGKFSAAELEQAKNPGDDRLIAGVADLTFGEYVRLIQDEHRWTKLSVAIDKTEFCKGLERVRDIRNDVMHFNPDGLESADMGHLREFAGYLRRLRSLGAM